MKKLLAFLLAALMVISLVACGIKQSEPTEATKAPTQAPTDAPEPTEEPVAAEDMVSVYVSYTEAQDISFFSLNFVKADGTILSLEAYPNGDGTAYIGMNDAIVKRGNVNESAMTTIQEAFDASGLKELESIADYAFSDELSLSYDISGELPEAFYTGYAAMLAVFTELTADLEEYVAKPAEYGEIADSDRVALDEILSNMELPGSPDSYIISGYAKDETFASNMSLTSDAGVASGLDFGAQMSVTTYALKIATLEDGTDANTVAANFESGINWREWVCVAPESAYIAIKGNQVLLLLGSMDLFDATVAGIEASGWTAYKTLKNPDGVDSAL